MRLWTLVNQGHEAPDGPILEVEDREDRFFDLWHGAALQPQRVGGRARLAVPMPRFGAIAALRPGRVPPAFRRLLRRQRREAQQALPDGDADTHVAAASVVAPKPPRVPAGVDAGTAAGMLRVTPGTQTFTVRHMRRECGGYPDPGTPPERQQEFLAGHPHDGTVEHRVTLQLPG